MSGILMPEVIIYNTLVAIIKLLRKNLIENSSTETESILYKLFGVDEDGNVIKMNSFEFFTQAKKIITKVNNLSVNFGYNPKVAQTVALHIILPSEQGKISIGADEGYIEEEELDDLDTKIANINYFTQLYESNYQIMITSDNSSEVNVVYNILKSMLLMLTEHLELSGLRNPSLSGNDIMMQDDISPAMIYHKVINLSFNYEHSVPQLIKNEVIKNFYYEMTVKRL